MAGKSGGFRFAYELVIFILRNGVRCVTISAYGGVAAVKIGVLVPLTNRVEEEFAKVRNLGLGSCQLCGWEEGLFTPEMARRVRTASEETGVSVSAFWCGWEPPAVWDFVDGPVTLGLVPAAYRMTEPARCSEAQILRRISGLRTWSPMWASFPRIPITPIIGAQWRRWRGWRTAAGKTVNIFCSKPGRRPR